MFPDVKCQVKTPADSSGRHKILFQAFPSGGYSQETRFGLGIYSVLLFHFNTRDTLTRGSIFDMGTIYTQNKQFYVTPTWKFFSPGQKYFIIGEGLFQYYTEKFFGIGNYTPASHQELYVHSLVRLDTRVQRKLFSHFYLGGHYNLEDMYDIDIKGAPGPISKNEVTGSRGGLASGVGYCLTYDSRNRVLMTDKGAYLDVQTSWFLKPLGSNFDFNSLTIDARKFIRFADRGVLAFQYYSKHINGEAPFRMLALLGGPMIMRGYYYGRFRDNNLVCAQAEMRLQLNSRIYTNLFAGAGEVGPNMQALVLKGVKQNYGAGIRYVYDRQERLDFRLDAGIGAEGNYGIYVTAGEAF